MVLFDLKEFRFAPVLLIVHCPEAWPRGTLVHYKSEQREKQVATETAGRTGCVVQHVLVTGAVWREDFRPFCSDSCHFGHSNACNSLISCN